MLADLIEFKITVKDLVINYFNNSNPGGGAGTGSINIEIPKSMVDVGVSPIQTLSEYSSGVSTVTPNSPITPTISSSSSISPILQTAFDKSVQCTSTNVGVEASTQTVITAADLTQNIRMIRIVDEGLPESVKSILLNQV
jgi:hypothetical protein